jgi:hypothetical protein
VTIPTVTTITNDVGITQTGADKVWGSATRTLTAFSTALALSVWDVLTANISTASSIGLKLKNWVLGSDNKSLLSSDAQTGVTIPTVTTLTNAPSDSLGVTTLLSRLSALRAGYLDNLSAGAAALESSLQTLITTIGAAGAGLTATASAVWAVATRVLTAGTNIVLSKGTGITGFNDLSAAAVNAEVDAALADYDGPTHAELTSELATADDATLTAIGGLNNLSQADVRSALGVASANLDTQLSTIPTTTQITNAVLDESLDSHNTNGTVGRALTDSPFTAGFRQENGSIIRFYGGEFDPSYLGESVVVVSSMTINYDNQHQGMLFVVDDTNFPAFTKFAAAILSSDQGDNSLTLSKPLPNVTAFDPIPFLILPIGIGDALTVEQIADAVWDEDIVAAHQEDDSAGKKLSQALILEE